MGVRAHLHVARCCFHQKQVGHHTEMTARDEISNWLTSIKLPQYIEVRVPACVRACVDCVVLFGAAAASALTHLRFAARLAACMQMFLANGFDDLEVLAHLSEEGADVASRVVRRCSAPGGLARV